jgi:hypothetical protein
VAGSLEAKILFNLLYFKANNAANLFTVKFTIITQLRSASKLLELENIDFGGETRINSSNGYIFKYFVHIPTRKPTVDSFTTPSSQIACRTPENDEQKDKLMLVAGQNCLFR